MGPRRQTEEQDRYAVQLGERLRRVRQQQGLSLHDVEEHSAGALKASVLGAYERGERSVSISRLRELATFYRVPIGELLPQPLPPEEKPQADEFVHVTIDLAELERRRELEPVLVRYVESIQQRRGDYNGRVLTVRGGDLDTLAAVLDASSEEVRERLVPQDRAD